MEDYTITDNNKEYMISFIVNKTEEEKNKIIFKSTE